MEIKKISDIKLEVTDTVTRYYNKEDLLEKKAALENRLLKINTLLLEFDK